MAKASPGGDRTLLLLAFVAPRTTPIHAPGLPNFRTVPPQPAASDSFVPLEMLHNPPPPPPPSLHLRRPSAITSSLWNDV